MRQRLARSLLAISPYARQLDADAAAYLRAVETADGSPLELLVRRAVNAFVLGCKNDGTWSAIKACCILAGARTLSGALIPLVGTAPTNFNFVSGDYDRKTGLLGNTSTKHLDSARNNAADPQNNRHLAVYRTTAEQRTGTRAFIGCGGSTSGDSMLLYTANQRFYRLAYSGSGSQSDTTAVIGFVGGSRNSGTEVIGRYAGASAAYSDTSVTPTSGNLVVFGRGSSGSPNALTDARLAFYSIGEFLDLALLDARVTTLINAFAAAIP